MNADRVHAEGIKEVSEQDARRDRILVVDDQLRNLRVLEALLQSMGYEVLLAEDGQSALEKIHRDPPDLILLDIMMPGLDGYEVLRRLKGNNKTMLIPVIMITALNDAQSRVRALEIGADDFLSKPADRSELMARVRSLLKVKAYHDQMANYQRDLEREVARITEQLRQAFLDIRETSLDTIYRLSQASEYKDESTGAHIERVSRFSATIATRMGMTDRTVRSLLYAAPMHDIGKIGIPDEILLKPGKLNDREWEIMKQHCDIGSHLLGGAKSDFLQMGEVISRTHHEWWDGSGYPAGLSEGEIPIYGRIVAVADVFDAVTSKRPYREPLSVESAFDYIKEESGSHFDPAVVSAFFSVRSDILKIKERYQERIESPFCMLSGEVPGEQAGD